VTRVADGLRELYFTFPNAGTWTPAPDYQTCNACHSGIYNLEI